MAKIVLKRSSSHKDFEKQTEKKLVLNGRELVQVLKSHRKASNISQAELARLVNLKRQSISNIERFAVDPQLSNVMEMLRLCGIRVILEFTSKHVRHDVRKVRT